jgi:serine/threonine protein kinase
MQKFAVKITRDGDEEKVLGMKNTFNILKNLKHENINPAYDLFINENTQYMYLVMNYCDYPTLDSLRIKKNFLSEKQAQAVIYRINKFQLKFNYLLLKGNLASYRRHLLHA